MGYIDQIIAKVKTNKKTIILPEGDDLRVLTAACACQQEGIANMIVIGTLEKAKEVHPQGCFDGIRFVDPAKAEDYEELANLLYELRKAKGMTPEKAREAALEPTTYGMLLLKANKADGLVSGAVNSTANTLRPALQILKTKPGTKLVSAFFLMIVPNCEMGAGGKFVFADCGLNENPDAEQLSEIAIASADSFKFLVGEEPVVAMLSYSSFGSAKSDLTEKVVQATRLAQEKAPQLKLDGELQVDSALVPATAARKAPTSKVQGNANVLVFPDLNAGNISYKLVQYLGKAEAYGPLLQGIAKPVNDLSRGCSAEDIRGVVAITCLQAQAEE